MSASSQPLSPEPLVYVPVSGNPRQLFVLLHGGGAAPAQVEALDKAIKQHFPDALVVLPYGAYPDGKGAYHWFKQQGLDESNYVGRVHEALPELVAYIRLVQAKYGLSGEHTALAGFDQGATIALEASLLHSDLAGRVLAFSGCYAQLPSMAPPATTLHLFHGADDPIIPVNDIRFMHSHLADLQGDATLDIGSRIGHELHEALIRQAIYRLQTCIPLRSWQAALSGLEQEGDQDQDDNDTEADDKKAPPTLH